MICDAWKEGREHIQQLCDKYGLKQLKRTPLYDWSIGDTADFDGHKVMNMAAYPEDNAVLVNEINSEFSYYGALHEIGHCVHPECLAIVTEKYHGDMMAYLEGPAEHILNNEGYAWEFALANSLYEFYDRPRTDMFDSLKCYYDMYKKDVENKDRLHPLILEAAGVITKTGIQKHG